MNTLAWIGVAFVGYLVLVRSRQQTAASVTGVVGSSGRGFSLQGPGFAIGSGPQGFTFGFGGNQQPQIPAWPVPAGAVPPAADPVDNPPDMPVPLTDPENAAANPAAYVDTTSGMPDYLVDPAVQPDPALFDNLGIPGDLNGVYGA